MGTVKSNVTRYRRTAYVLAVAALVVSACSSTDEPTVEQSAESSTTSSIAAAVEADSTAVDETFWYAGFKVTLGDADLTPSPNRSPTGQLAIDASFENQGTSSAGFGSVEVNLSSGDEFYRNDASELPTVPGEATGKGTFAFVVEPSFSFDDAVLTVGSAENNQATIPLGDEGELVTNEPVPITSTPSGTAGQFTVQVKGGELRFDDPDAHRALEDGKTLIALDFDLTRTGGQINTNFSGSSNLALQLPDGTQVTVLRDGKSNPNELVAPDETLRDLTVRFEGDIPYAGDYALILKYDGTDGPAEAEIPFTVTELTPGGTTGTTAVTGTTS